MGSYSCVEMQSMYSTAPANEAAVDKALNKLTNLWLEKKSITKWMMLNQYMILRLCVMPIFVNDLLKLPLQKYLFIQPLQHEQHVTQG